MRLAEACKAQRPSADRSLACGICEPAPAGLAGGRESLTRDGVEALLERHLERHLQLDDLGDPSQRFTQAYSKSVLEVELHGGEALSDASACDLDS
jgi:hypothetical protein